MKRKIVKRRKSQNDVINPVDPAGVVTVIVTVKIVTQTAIVLMMMNKHIN